MIEITQSKTADTRTCDWSKVTKDELLKASHQHIDDVRKGMSFFINHIYDTASCHDSTKISHIDMFHEDFKTGFKKTDWWELHQKRERHHLKDAKYVQDDVDLIDILEMITDGVMAGLARSGEYRKEEIPDSLLRKAFDNTIELLLKNVTVKKDSTDFFKNSGICACERIATSLVEYEDGTVEPVCEMCLSLKKKWADEQSSL
jgi:hypothetical protein